MSHVGWVQVLPAPPSVRKLVPGGASKVADGTNGDGTGVQDSVDGEPYLGYLLQHQSLHKAGQVRFLNMQA